MQRVMEFSAPVPFNGCTPTPIPSGVNPLVKPYLGLWPHQNRGTIGNGDVGILQHFGDHPIHGELLLTRLGLIPPYFRKRQPCRQIYLFDSAPHKRSPTTL